MIRVILNGFALEEPNGYESTLNLHAKMLVNGLHCLAYDVERVISVVSLKIDIPNFNAGDSQMCQVIHRYDNLGLFEFLGLEHIERDVWEITIAFIPSEEAIEKTWKRAQKLYKAPLLVTQTLMITGNGK